ncbi:holo-ACP synthase [Nocardioides terrisoli]|uniref:holo-ACP synthase n=1 Tax=Nocardioides terrisoli TaxID=3388267 RepID=UPI00287BC7A2|nr:holo-ACP synthase [Nocardioides marmorisolisilvae]
MIVGVGIDVVDLGRFEESLARTPRLRDKLFTEAEAALPMQSLAARFAAKEALAKALGAPAGLEWHDAEVVSLPDGRPTFALRGTVRARAESLSAAAVHLSLSHDAGIASAVVVLESAT